jgi:uncharacterized oligopeptide transporter (OPT) family protein
MTANVASGAAAHSGELLTDLKSGHLLGASPRKQLVAQLFGILAGSACCVPAYLLIVKDAQLGSSALPAPAAVQWRTMAEFLASGGQNLPRWAATASVIGALLGASIAAIDELFPRVRRFTPSATGLGIALVIDAQDSFAMLAGALMAYALSRRGERWKDASTSLAAGLLVGEGLMGITLALLKALRLMS